MTLFKSVFLPVGPNKLQNGSVKVIRTAANIRRFEKLKRKVGLFLPKPQTHTTGN